MGNVSRVPGDGPVLSVVLSVGSWVWVVLLRWSVMALATEEDQNDDDVKN